MNRPHTREKSGRLVSAVTGSGEGNSIDAHNYPTQTLFERVKAEKSPLLHNMVIIGRLRDTWDKQPELGDYYQTLMNSSSGPMGTRSEYRQQNAIEDQGSASATGLLLIFPSLFVHYLEVTDAALQLILEDLNQAMDPSRSNGLIREARILNISYNISARLYATWSFKSIKLAVEDLDAQPAETTEVVAMEVLGKLLKLAKYQADERQRYGPSVDVLTNIDQQRADLLPNQVSINYLLKQPNFRLAEDVLKNERRPINVRLESDLTAPPTHRLFPITL